MGTFQAKYGGSCEGCEERIVPGDRVLWVEGGLVHAGCADPDLRVRRRPVKEVTCTGCFIVKPCECDDERREKL